MKGSKSGKIVLINNRLNQYHEGISEYVREHKWLSISANEIVEYNIRSVPLNEMLGSPRIIFRKILLLFIISMVIFLSPLFFIFSTLYFVAAYSIRCRKKNDFEIKDVFFIRNNLSRKRYELLIENELSDNSLVIIDDFKFSYNRGINLSSFLKFSPISFFIKLFRELVYIISDFLINVPDIDITKLSRACARAPHLLLVEQSLENMCEINRIQHIRSFEMISRFSSLLNNLVSKHSVNTATCYPHGLEYDVFYPHGYFGNVTYTTSRYASQKLNSRYASSNFVFDKKLIDLLFSYDIKVANPKEYVYYTDARNIKEDYLNIINLQGKVKYVKLHPIDSISNYPNIELKVIDDFFEAVSYGAIIMRASTVLFEGFNSNCLVYCLATNDKERYLVEYLYPTLSKLKMEKLSSLNDLKILKERE